MTQRHAHSIADEIREINDLIAAEHHKRQRLINITILATLAFVAALALPLATHKVLATEQALRWEARI